MNIKALILCFAAVILVLYACKKGSGDIVTITLTTPVNVINATTDTLNFYQNGTRLNNTTNLYPFGSLGYAAITIGTQNYQFKKAGTQNALLSVPLTLDTLTAFTVFVAGQTADNVFLTRDVFAVQDTTVKIRYVNASPLATNVDVYIGSTFVAKNVAFKAATAFGTVRSGKNALSIYQAGTTTLLAGGTLTLTAATTYTLYTKGVLNGTGANLFGARILVTGN